MSSSKLGLLAAAALALTTFTVASPPATAQQVVKPHRLDVVQLGDSYSAGNGAGGYTDTTCYRSPRNYGTQFARTIHASYLNRACSGAVTRDLTHSTAKGSSADKTHSYKLSATKQSTARRQWLAKARAAHLCGTTPTKDAYFARSLGPLTQTGSYWTGTLSCQLKVPAQVNAVNRGTDIVLLTIGGNDIGFSNIVVKCMALREEMSCKQAMDDANALLPATSKRLRHVFDVVRTRSHGHAKVYLLPYPNLLNTTSYTVPEGVPGGYDFGAALRKLQTRGDRLQQATVAAYDRGAGHGRYHWVAPVISIWRGHGLDPHLVPDNSKAWLVPFGTPGRATAEYVHPLRAGWNASAKALERYYAGHH
ncbi:MAG: SGNH/GDSL hydrolase family protein [Marmoricola sp.]